MVAPHVVACAAVGNGPYQDRFVGPEVVTRIGFLRLGVELLSQVVHDRFRAWVSGALPDRLVFAGFEALSLDKEAVRVVSYSPFDPLDLPGALVDLLHHFDGSPTGEALSRIAREQNMDLDEEIVRMLIDFDVLASA